VNKCVLYFIMFTSHRNGLIYTYAEYTNIETKLQNSWLHAIDNMFRNKVCRSIPWSPWFPFLTFVWLLGWLMESDLQRHFLIRFDHIFPLYSYIINLSLSSCYGSNMIRGDLSSFECELHATAGAGGSSGVGSSPAGACNLTPNQIMDHHFWACFLEQ